MVVQTAGDAQQEHRYHDATSVNAETTSSGASAVRPSHAEERFSIPLIDPKEGRDIAPNTSTAAAIECEASRDRTYRERSQSGESDQSNSEDHQRAEPAR